MDITKKVALALAAALAAAGLFACSSICDRLEAVGNSLETKFKPCDTAPADAGTEEKFDKKRCDAAIAKCTGDDQAKINKWMDCLDKIGTCTKGQEDAWENSQLNCATQNLAGISTACLQAIIADDTDGGS